MWKILKAELQYYYKTPLIITVCVIIWLFIIFSFSGGSQLEEDLIGFMIVAMSITGVSWFVMIMDKYKSKRERLHAGLPVSIGLIGISRLLIVYIFWLAIVLCFCITLVHLRPDIKAGDIFWKFISFNGVILFFNTSYTLSCDLCNFITRKFKIFGIYNDQLTAIIFPRLTVLILLLFFTIPHYSMPLRTHIVDVIFSSSGSLIFNVIGSGLFCLSAAVYVRRRSFFV